MKKGYIVGATVVMMALSGCEEGGKDNSVSAVVEAKSVKVSSDVPNLKGVRFGPTEIFLGQDFNKQPNGESAFWFVMTGEINPGTKLELWFGSTKLSDVVLTPNLSGSTTVPSSLLSQVGDFPFYLIHSPSKKRYDIGIFKIKPAPAAKSVAPTDTTTVAATKKLVKNKAKEN